MQSLPKQINESGDVPLNGSVCHQLFGLWLQVRRETDARMLSHGLTEAQWKPLWMIKIGRASTAHEVARVMGIDASAVTRLIDRLEAKGLVLRMRSASDRRVVHLSLTAAGHEALEVVPRVLASVNDDFTRGLSPEELAQACDLLRRMSANGALIGAPACTDPVATPLDTNKS